MAVQKKKTYQLNIFYFIFQYKLIENVFAILSMFDDPYNLNPNILSIVSYIFTVYVF